MNKELIKKYEALAKKALLDNDSLSIFGANLYKKVIKDLKEQTEDKMQISYERFIKLLNEQNLCEPVRFSIMEILQKSAMVNVPSKTGVDLAEGEQAIVHNGDYFIHERSKRRYISLMVSPDSLFVKILGGEKDG